MIFKKEYLKSFAETSLLKIKIDFKQNFFNKIIYYIIYIKLFTSK